MTIAQGLSKKVILKEEVTWGTASGPAGGEVLRRTQASFSLTKEKYTSAEIRTDKQVAFSSHGVRSVTGSLNGEMSPLSYAPLFEALYMRDFVAGVVIAATDVTVAASGDNWTLTRSVGSWITDGLKIGSSVRLSVGTMNALNLNKNLVIIGLTTLVATVKVMNGSLMFAEAITGATITEVGSKTYVPLTGHTEKSFTIEEYFSDIAQSHVYTGNKVGSANITMNATGLTTVDFSLMGKDITTGTSQYFTAPAAQVTSSTMASVNGVLLVDGSDDACVTSLTLNHSKGLNAANCVGNNTAHAIFTDALIVSGSATVYFENAILRDKFLNEQEGTMIVSLATTGAANADFITFVIGKLKLNSFNVDDSNTGGLSATVEFEALLNTDAATNEDNTTISIQDSAVV